MKNLIRLSSPVLLTLVWGGSALAQNMDGCQASVTVQPGDTLGTIAKRELGSSAAYTNIVAATNRNAATDSSFATISNPNVIEPGQKLCVAIGMSPPRVVERTKAPAPPLNSGNTTNITFLQINDVYEMTPVGGQGGVARLATLDKELTARNPNTFSVLSGDLFSPSALGTAKVDGERLAGKQMVAAMNAFDLDFATLGNHEFDIKEEQFLERIKESETQWFVSNAFKKDGTPFDNISQNLIFSVTDNAGQDVTVGMFGVMLDSNPADYVSYTDPFEAAGAHINVLKDNVDILIGVTHLSMAQDMKLAGMYPDIDLIMGGHEHENAIEYVGGTPITKADANARTAYIIDLTYDHGSDSVTIKPTLKQVTADIPDDPVVASVVNFWLEQAFEGFRAQGFEPTKRVTNVTDALDGTEASVRNKTTVLTQIIADSMLSNASGADIALYNGGSIRIDDTIAPGPITEYDVIRILPFGGAIITVDMTGSMLQRTLDQGVKNSGIGSYLHTAGVSGTLGNWSVNGTALDSGGTYTVAINDFLLTGYEQNLEFLKAEGNPDINQKATHDDLRKALITELQKKYGSE
ncbi:MAG: LysM peptidoglycan-binding domain-containing protein [Hellea sp.]|nr:LysM peptidoglycan-binding domain-containing protein [Hellea sp.]